MTPAESAQLARIETNLQRHTDFMDERYGSFVGALGTLTDAIMDSNALLRATLAQTAPKKHANGKQHSLPDVSTMVDDPDTGVREIVALAIKKKMAGEYIMSWVRASGTIFKFILTVTAVLALTYGIITKLGEKNHDAQAPTHDAR